MLAHVNRYLILAVITAGVLLCSGSNLALAASSSANFGLQGSTQLASGGASSTSFTLRSCVDASPSGRSSSGSFSLQSGCPALAAAAALPPIVPPQPPIPELPAVPVPSAQLLARLALVLGVILLAGLWLRSRPAAGA